MPDAGGPESGVTVDRAEPAKVGVARSSAPAVKEQSLMSRLRNLTLRSKLLLMLLPIGLVSMGTQAILSHVNGTRAMLAQGTDLATAVRQSKKQQVEAFFSNLRDTFPVFGDDVAVVSATGQFRDTFNQLGRGRLADERRRKLEDLYRNELVPALAAKALPGEQLLFENIWPRTDRSIEAQTLFLAENRFKIGERAKLLDHPVSNPYTLAHFTYHGWFRDVKQRLKLYDLMLADADTGSLIYSVEKEADFGTSLQDGPYANTNVGRLFRRVLAEHKKGFVALSDFELYPGSLMAPSMFIATPVYANFKLTGVLIGQISVAGLNQSLNGSNSWKQDGLGETGLAYIAGSSKLLRSDHRKFIEDQVAFFAPLRQAGMSEATINGIIKSNSTILKLEANVEAVDRAQRGETGTLIGNNILGVRAVQAYAPLNIPDLSWVLVSQINTDEVLASVNAFQRSMMILACGLALATTLASMWLASRFLRPVAKLMTGMEGLRAGRTDVKVEKLADDEFGELTDNFNAMAEMIRARDRKITEKASGNDQLLKRLFPQSIAERMIKGESQIVDTVTNVTIVYASILGFVKLTEGKPAADSMSMLNEIFDLLDQAAAEHGIDRIKTIGEHYIAACGLSEPRLDHGPRAVAFCDTVARELKRLSDQKSLQLDMRASLASGDINAGLIGDRRFAFEVWGRPLNYARRLIHEATTNEVRITEATYQLLGPDNGFKERPAVEGRTLGTIRNYARRAALTEPAPLAQAAE
jgi:class 3 adenylate cyclase